MQAHSRVCVGEDICDVRTSLVDRLSCSALPLSASLLCVRFLSALQLEGFLLQGCGFQNGLLSPLSPDSPSMVQLPPCTLAYIPKEEGEPYPDPGALAVPVYVATTREEFVCEIRVPCKGQADRWILSGVALFLSDYK
jgi:hypothetical protein